MLVLPEPFKWGKLYTELFELSYWFHTLLSLRLIGFLNCLVIEFPILIPDSFDSSKNSEVLHGVDTVAQETSLLFNYLNSLHNTNLLEAGKMN